MRSLAVAVLAVACTPAPPATSASSGTSTTSATSTSTASSDVTSSATTGATTDATAGVSTGVTADATTTTTSPSPTSDTTAPGDPQCLPVAGDHGLCQTPLGWAFDGQECTPRSGCDCAPDCDSFFPTAAACAEGCAARHCNADRLVAAGIASDPVQPGDHCDGLYMCPGDDALLQSAYEQIFGMLSCEPGAFPCGPELCAGLWAGSLGPDEWHKLCAASLLPASGPLYCAVFGP